MRVHYYLSSALKLKGICYRCRVDCYSVGNRRGTQKCSWRRLAIPVSCAGSEDLLLSLPSALNSDAHPFLLPFISGKPRHM